MTRSNGAVAGLASTAMSTTVFCIGFSLIIQEPRALGAWPGVFIIAALQHIVVVTPAYLVIRRLWRPVTRSPLWSFALWGAGLASAPWLLLALTDKQIYWNFHASLVTLTFASGIAGGLIFGKLMREPPSPPSA